MSKYTTYTVPELLALGGNVVEILSAEVSRGYPAEAKSLANGLNTADLMLQNAEDAQKAAMIAAKARTAAKLVAKDDVASRIATIGAICAAAPGVTDEMLVALGFPARRGASPRPKLPQPVAGLAATPDVLGGVKLRWDKGANGGAVSYLVEFSLDAGATWGLLDTTRRGSISASGFAPGAPAWFRVTSTAAAGRSAPSAAASVYAPVAPIELKLAA